MFGLNKFLQFSSFKVSFDYKDFSDKQLNEMNSEQCVSIELLKANLDYLMFFIILNDWSFQQLEYVPPWYLFSKNNE